MKKKTLSLLLFAFATAHSVAMDKLGLDGIWDFRFEKGVSLEEVKMPGFAADDRMVVPGCWDAMSCYYNQRGTGCYRRKFELKEDVLNAFLVVDGCALRSRFWIDGREIGTSVIPWIKFDFRTGPLQAGEHEIVAAVDSIVDNTKVKLFWNFYDFYASGGFHHGVWLEVQKAPDSIRKVVVRTRDYRSGMVELELRFAAENAPEDFSAKVAFDKGPVQKVEFKNRRVTLPVPDFKLWSHVSPNLHTVKVTLPTFSQRSARFGIRQVGVSGNRMTLNGQNVYLKGVNRHEAHYEFGSTTPIQIMYEDIKNLKNLGGNFIRGAHYPQTEKFLNLCDELGVLVWEESLGWGNRSEQLKDPEFIRLQEEETRMTVRESINHPCIIISGFLNEPYSGLPECRDLVNRLVEVVRSEDTGHLVTFACSHTTKDISHVKTDIIAYNTYPCWYNHPMQTGSYEEMRSLIAQCHQDVIGYFRNTFKDDRPFIVSEIGVKADYGVRDPRGKAQYTEDFQAEYTKLVLEETFKVREIAGIAIWQFTDAKTYTRTPGMMNRSYGVNTGGLYDLYRRPKLAVDAVRELYTAKKEGE